MEGTKSLENFIKGTCVTMCPEKELKMREREGLLHVFEVEQINSCSNNQKAVKTFSRSAAGQKMPLPSDLRPPSVLKKTVSYLLGSIASRTDCDWTEVYDFVFDRLRAVRQDLVIQGISGGESVSILESIIRFHAYASYRLCDVCVEKFDKHINLKHLQECLKRVLVLYDNGVASDAREEMEALYLLLNFGTTEALWRGLHLDKKFRCSIVGKVLKASLHWWRGNYIHIYKLLPSLPPILACVTAIHVPKIRRQTLMVMSTAYSSKNLRYPLSSLQKLLLYANMEEAEKECLHYGISVENKHIQFLKGSFDHSADMSSASRLDFIDTALESVSVADLLLCSPKEECR